MHLNQAQLLELLNNARMQIEVGGLYVHYKSPDQAYRVKDVVINEADNLPYVIYQAQYGNQITFSRPLAVWLEQVEYEGEVVPRFTKVTSRD